jgi:predicted GIY-YIG superfamily endonuclease
MPFEALAKQGYPMFMYYAYILRSETYSQYYYGSTSDLQKRLRAHNAGTSSHTAKFRPWTIVWYGAFETKVQAEAFEHYLKAASGKAFLRKRLVHK